MAAATGTEELAEQKARLQVRGVVIDGVMVRGVMVCCNSID